jgi:hypothetical protein
VAFEDPVLHVTNAAGDMNTRIEDSALVIGARSNYIVLSHANAADLQTAFDSYASTGSYS